MPDVLRVPMEWNKDRQIKRCFVCGFEEQPGDKTWSTIFVTNAKVQSQRRDYCSSECISEDAEREEADSVAEPVEL